MELRHIRYFIAAAEEEHFGRASDRLCVTRPAVSQIISDLESELGTLLFERLAHRVKLTAAGRALLPDLQALMANLHTAVNSAKRVGNGKSGSLNIGYGSLTLMNSVFKATIKQFRESYPDVSLSLVELPTHEQPRALADKRIHAGFMHFGPGRTLLRKKRNEGESSQDDTVLDWINIQEGGLGVVMLKDHRLARKKAVTLVDLKEERFIVVPQGSISPGYGPLFALCQEVGFEPQIVQEVGTISSQLNLISVGMGIGLISTGRNFSYPSDLVVLPLNEVSYSTSFVFAWVKGENSPALDRMIEIIAALSK